MKVLIIGSGGREHALAWRLARDSARPELFCAPGNAGTASLALNVPVAADNVRGLLEWAQANRPELTVVGPEAPLCAGITDTFQAAGLRVFGPSAAAARLEGSKVFAKEVMESAGVPTARSASFQSVESTLAYVRSVPLPVVVKADGLASGKGVTICHTLAQAESAVRAAMVDRVFGDAGRSVVIEEYLEGEEASILALVDGENVVSLASAQDHKRVFNNDEGPNTGGMGAYSPAPVVQDALWPVIRDEVFGRTLKELRRRGIAYKGVLYAGIMITPKGLRVLEFNCRFGDPETQAVLVRLDSDLLPALQATVDGGLCGDMVRWLPGSSVCVVMAAGGYPGTYTRGKVIEGLDVAAQDPGVVVFHAGTRLVDGRVVTDGGRVLGVTAMGSDVRDAIRCAYRAVSRLSFDQAQYRTDIGSRALARLQVHTR